MNPIPSSSTLDPTSTSRSPDLTASALWLKDAPRARRALVALLAGPVTREQIDRISGSSNGPNLIGSIRKRLGIEIPCVMKPKIDRDGFPTRHGEYHLALDARGVVRELIAELAKDLDDAEEVDASESQPSDGGCMPVDVLERAVKRWLDGQSNRASVLKWLGTLLGHFDASQVAELRPPDRERFFHHLISMSCPRSPVSLTEAE